MFFSWFYLYYILYIWLRRIFFSVSVVKNIVIYYEILYIYICIHVLALIVDRSCYLNVYHIFDIIFVMHTLLERFWLVVDVTWNQRHKVICKFRLDSVKHLKQWTDLKVVICFANCFDVWRTFSDQIVFGRFQTLIWTKWWRHVPLIWATNRCDVCPWFWVFAVMRVVLRVTNKMIASQGFFKIYLFFALIIVEVIIWWFSTGCQFHCEFNRDTFCYEQGIVFTVRLWLQSRRIHLCNISLINSSSRWVCFKNFE